VCTAVKHRTDAYWVDGFCGACDVKASGCFGEVCAFATKNCSDRSACGASTPVLYGGIELLCLHDRAIVRGDMKSCYLLVEIRGLTRNSFRCVESVRSFRPIRTHCNPLYRSFGIIGSGCKTSISFIFTPSFALSGFQDDMGSLRDDTPRPYNRLWLTSCSCVPEHARHRSLGQPAALTIRCKLGWDSA